MEGKGKLIIIFSLALSLALHILLILTPYYLSFNFKYPKNQKTAKGLKKGFLKLVNINLSHLELPPTGILESLIKNHENTDSTLSVIQNRVLSLIYKKIASIWNDSVPPEPGKVKVRISLNKFGEISSMDVLTNTGSIKLKEFVLSLIKKASPFDEIREVTQKEKIVVDCVFVIN